MEGPLKEISPKCIEVLEPGCHDRIGGLPRNHWRNCEGGCNLQGKPGRYICMCDSLATTAIVK